jgi:hypothetical protein
MPYERADELERGVVRRKPNLVAGDVAGEPLDDAIDALG